MTIPEMWRAEWTAPLFNHLWQSTLVLAAGWLLTLVFRCNPARIRYAIWMVASLKFLVPFALVSSIGEQWVRPFGGKATTSALYTAADEMGQPFQPSYAPSAHSLVPAHSGDWLAMSPAMLGAIWLCGVIIVLARWMVRWRRISLIAKSASPIEEGRELEAVRRAEARAGLQTPIPVCFSSHAIEPGVFGVFRPVLLWPAGISAQLNDAQVESIVAHEVEHVRRRDNLTAAVHMLVEALFWFYPAVHWAGSRMMEERERACDEKVLELSARPETYAESILKVCAFCLESPVPCVSGVSGSDLKQRVLRIMTHPSGIALSTVRKCALAAAAIGAITVPLGFGMLHGMQLPAQLVHSPAAPAPAFDVVSIKPNHETRPGRMIGMSPTGFTARHASLKDLIGFAFGMKGADQLINAPSWANSEFYDIEAKVSEADIEAGKSQSMDERKTRLVLMVQSLLADRFGLKTSIETRELPVYALVVAKGGVKMQHVQLDPYPPEGTPPPRGAHVPRLMKTGPMQYTATAWPMGLMGDWLSHFDEVGNRVVVDETELNGNFDFVLNGVSLGSIEGNRDSSEEPAVSIFSALPEQLGLKLDSRRAPVEVLVVERAEHPSPN